MTRNLDQVMVIWKSVVTLALVAYWITLFVGTHIPIDPEFGIPGNDKTLHFVGYGILGALLMSAYLAPRHGSPPEASTVLPISLWLGLWSLIAAYGALDELTQPWVGRHCDFNDWLADISGSAIGLALAWVIWWSVCIRGRAREKEISNPKTET